MSERPIPAADEERPLRATRRRDRRPDLTGLDDATLRRMGERIICDLAARYCPPIPSDNHGDNLGDDTATAGQHGR